MHGVVLSGQEVGEPCNEIPMKLLTCELNVDGYKITAVVDSCLIYNYEQKYV